MNKKINSYELIVVSTPFITRINTSVHVSNTKVQNYKWKALSVLLKINNSVDNTVCAKDERQTCAEHLERSSQQ